MDKLDQFESVFRSADKQVFHYGPLSVRSVLVVTDLEGDAAQQFSADVQTFTAALTERIEESLRTPDHG